MAVKKIFSVDPLFEVEIMAHSLISDVIARLDVGDDNIIEGFVQFFLSKGTWDDHLLEMLNLSGKSFATNLEAIAYIQATPAAEVEALLKDVWNNFLKLLSELVNKYWSANGSGVPTPVPGTHKTAESVIQALLNRTEPFVKEDKTLELRIP